MVVSVGELAFDKNMQMLHHLHAVEAEVDESDNPGRPIEEGDIVVFDQIGHRPVQLASLQGDVARLTRLIYSQVDAVLDEESIAQWNLHDFEEERKHLADGNRRALYAS